MFETEESSNLDYGVGTGGKHPCIKGIIYCENTSKIPSGLSAISFKVHFDRNADAGCLKMLVGRSVGRSDHQIDGPTDHRPCNSVLGRSVRGRTEIRTTRPTTVATAISYYSVGRFLKPSRTPHGGVLLAAELALFQEGPVHPILAHYVNAAQLARRPVGAWVSDILIMVGPLIRFFFRYFGARFTHDFLRSFVH